MNKARGRLMSDPEVAAAFDVLSNRLSGTDLRSFLLAVASERASRVQPSDALRQQRTDRFCEASDLDAVALATAQATALEMTASSQFEPVQLSPLAPLGTSSTFGSVPQNNVVTTTRLCEVVSDPTNALALVAGARRRLLRDRSETTRLSAVQRVVRAQQFDAPGSFPHFSLLGLISVGRDRGSRRFEVDELTQQLTTLVDVAKAIVPTGTLRVDISDNSLRRDEAMAMVEKLSPVVEASFVGARKRSVDYYPQLCAKLTIERQGTVHEIGDGGVTNWASALAADNKERLVITGLSLERLVWLSEPRAVRRAQ